MRGGEGVLEGACVLECVCERALVGEVWCERVCVLEGGGVLEGV